MSVTQQSQSRTRMFARVLGPFFAVIATTVAARAPHMAALLAQFTASDVWPWVVGAFILMGGIAIVAFHQYWRSPAAVIVSVLGWLLVVRGVFLLAFPEAFASLANRMIGAAGAWQAAYIIMALIGLYLTFVGWMPASSQVHDNVSHATRDLPRAA
jgi:hypothetical protein